MPASARPKRGRVTLTVGAGAAAGQRTPQLHRRCGWSVYVGYKVCVCVPEPFYPRSPGDAPPYVARRPLVRSARREFTEETEPHTVPYCLVAHSRCGRKDEFGNVNFDQEGLSSIWRKLRRRGAATVAFAEALLLGPHVSVVKGQPEPVPPSDHIRGSTLRSEVENQCLAVSRALNLPLLATNLVCAGDDHVATREDDLPSASRMLRVIVSASKPNTSWRP